METNTDFAEETGVADVRLVRDKIAALYNGDLHRHIAETDRIVEPLISEFGLEEGVPQPKRSQRSGTEG